MGQRIKAWLRLVIVSAIVVFFVWLLAYGFTRDARFIQSPLIGRMAPDFTLTRFDGGTLSLKDLRGKTVLVNFWASWCPPCRVEAPALEAAWQAYKDKDVVFVGVDIQDKEPDARGFIKEFGITYPNGWDVSGKVPVDYGVWGLPETFFLDKEGRITYKHVGGVGQTTIVAKINEAMQGIVSTGEGKGNYQSIR
ncbi:MAG: TlpA disulfide reductase family protein [Deltaproteobacteria bacterium]|nr:TlpA disulfide reductase family protein [Deltaproteobacteria bacterium]